MGVFAWMVTGLIAGALAKAATGTSRDGCLFTMAIGVLGALIGGALFTAAGSQGVDDFSVWSIFVAFIGATGLLLVLRAIRGH